MRKSKLNLGIALLISFAWTFMLTFTPFQLSTPMLNTTVVSAANAAVPNNNVYGNGNKNKSSGKNGIKDGDINQDNVADLFGMGQDSPIGDDPTGYSETIGGWAQGLSGFLINTAIKILASLFPAMIIVDMLIIVFPPFGVFFGQHMPFQCFSSTCSKITGVTFSPKSANGGGAPGGAPAAAPASGGPGGQGQDTIGSKFKSYFKEMGVLAVIVFLVMFLAYTGILMDLIYKAVAFIANIIRGAVD